MDQTSNTAIEERVKTTRVRRNKKEISGVTNIDATEARLSTHEQVCAERYKAIEAKFHTVDERMDRIEADIKELQASSSKNFADIKNMLTAAKDEKFKVIVGSASTVIVALLGMMGYLLTHLPK